MTKEDRKLSRRKILKGLECCKYGPDSPDKSCSLRKCPYYKSETCDLDLFEDAIALIKEDGEIIKQINAQTINKLKEQNGG